MKIQNKIPRFSGCCNIPRCKKFFRSELPKSQEAAESPNVAKLLAVLDGILSEQQNNRTNGTATQNNTHFSSTK